MENFRSIVITGPESTGKTEIAAYLAKRLNCEWVPEYARSYIENLKFPYNYSDVENIAKKQVEDYYYHSNRNSLVIFDTWLIITKVWFGKVFQRYPSWLDDSINSLKIDLYLLCAPDLEWKPDSVRENGGEMRKELYYTYEKEIKKTNAPYGIVRGMGEERYRAAEKILKSYL